MFTQKGYASVDGTITPLDEATVEINVWHGDYDSGRAIVEQVKAAFDRSSFNLAGGGRVLHMRRVEDRDELPVRRLGTCVYVRELFQLGKGSRPVDSSKLVKVLGHKTA